MDEQPLCQSPIVGYKHILATYTWPLVLFSIVIVFPFLTPYQATTLIHSNSRSFHHNNNPFYFVHLSDVHVSKDKPKLVQKYNQAINWTKSTSAKHVIITGDLVDNWQRHHLYKRASQNINDHQAYFDSTFNFSKTIDLLVDISGNHDEFDVYSFDSPNHRILNYSTFYHKMEIVSYENFTILPYELTDEITILLINPVTYPYTLGLIDNWIQVPVEFMDRLEKHLNELQKTNKTIILAAHHPLSTWISVRSSHGHDYQYMLNNYNISAVFAGHLHLPRYFAVHHKENIEFISSDLYSHNVMGLVTYDNGNFVYNEFKLGDELKAVVTNPQPWTQLSRYSTFNSKDIPIRLLVWSNNTFENITVSGDAEGIMIPVRTIEENVTLYELNASFEYGYHNLKFSGFYKGELKFFNGNILPGYIEPRGNFDNLFIWIPNVYYPVFIILFIILFPFNIESFFPSFQKIMNDVFEWLHNEEKSIKSILSDMFLGFFITRWKIQKVSPVIRWTLFVLLFSIYFVPVYIQVIEGHYGFVSFYGYTNGGHTTKTAWGPFFRLMHVFFVIWPSTNLVAFLSMYITKNDWTKAYIADIFFICFSAVGCFGFTLLKMSESTYLYFSITSPLLILEFFITIPLAILERRLRKARQFRYSNLNENTENDIKTDETLTQNSAML